MGILIIMLINQIALILFGLLRLWKFPPAHEICITFVKYTAVEEMPLL